MVSRPIRGSRGLSIALIKYQQGLPKALKAPTKRTARQHVRVFVFVVQIPLSRLPKHKQKHRERERESHTTSFLLCFAHPESGHLPKGIHEKMHLFCVDACVLARWCRFTFDSRAIRLLFTSNLHHVYMYFSWCICLNTCPTHFIISFSSTF